MTTLEHRFSAEIVSRTGIAHEELILRPAGNNQWMMACRIDGHISKCQQPDSAWPRDPQIAKSGTVCVRVKCIFPQSLAALC